MTLVEVLVSIALIAAVLGTATTGIIALNRTTAAANDAARANLLVTGFGETLKRLEYVDCFSGDLDEAYNDAFVAYQAQLPAGEELLRPGDTAEVVDGGVVVDNACSPGDPGVQTISFEVTTRNTTRTGEIVKRNPDYTDGLFAEFTACRITAPGGGDPCNPVGAPTTGGDQLAVFTLNASGSSPIARIVEFTFECGDAANTVITTTVPDDPAASCEYLATTTAETKTITLTVTDAQGRTATTTRPAPVPAVAVARGDPIPQISATCPPIIGQCTSGTANPGLLVSFDGSGSVSLEGTIVLYEWDFGDVNSGSENTKEGATATHTYTRGGTFTVRLTVTDEIGVSATATRNIVVTRPGPVPPTASFTYGPNPAVAPQTITFDGTASRTAANGAVDSYLWDFGDGTTSPESAPRHSYTTPGTYNVTLTVTDAATSATTSRQVVIGTFQSSPVNIRMTDAKGCIVGLFCTGHFYFAWTNVAASAGDVVTYEIEISHNTGQCFGFNTESRLVVAGAPGTAQTFDYAVPPASDVCYLNTYDWRVRSIRENSEVGSITSAWSPYTTSQVRRFGW